MADRKSRKKESPDAPRAGTSRAPARRRSSAGERTSGTPSQPTAREKEPESEPPQRTSDEEARIEGDADLIPRPSANANGASRARSAGTKQQTGKYVYCIIHSNERCSFGRIGIGAEPTEVYTIGYEDIAAVVSDTPLEVYDPTRENVLSHEHVNEIVMHENTVIPMSFGTVFKTADDIVELLRSAYSAFRDVLVKMEGKLEFGLKVLWEPDEIIADVEKEDESLRRLREEILKQRGSTYFARMQYERLVDSLLQERSERFVGEIFGGLQPVSVATRANKPIGERMILNAAFLVSRDQEEDFDAEVKRIGAHHPHLTFKYTGPWPPYNFVNIRLKLERAQEAE